VQATVQQPHRVPDGAPVHYERHRPEQTTLYRLVQQHAATFAECEAICAHHRPVRLSWAKLLKRVFDSTWSTARTAAAS
jgi:hypothetical protein